MDIVDIFPGGCFLINVLLYQLQPWWFTTWLSQQIDASSWPHEAGTP